MKTTKRTVAGRDYWFMVEPACDEVPETGELIPTGQYYCAFSAQEPGPTNWGEVLKNDGGLANLFPTPELALEAGAREVEARLHLPTRAFAVGLPYRTKQTDYAAYGNLLRQQGIEVNGKAGVEGSFGRKWPHVWDSRDEAERFAARLRQATGNRDWEVYDLSPPRPSANGQGERSGPLVILVDRQSDGTTYALHPNSLKRTRRQFPQATQQSTLFLGRDAQGGSEPTRAPVYDQVATLLTGLSREQLMELGGYRIVDPITDLALYQAAPDR